MIEHFDSATGNVSVAEHLPVRRLDEDEALWPFKAIKVSSCQYTSFGVSYVAHAITSDGKYHLWTTPDCAANYM